MKARNVTFVWGVIIAIAVLSACDDKPKHYFVLCEAKDSAGWALIGTEEKDGYLMSCTYQSPDRNQTYTARCTDKGCD